MEKPPLHFSLGNEGVGRAEAVVDTIWWGAGAELLLTRTEDNARLSEAQCRGLLFPGKATSGPPWGPLHVPSCGFAGEIYCTHER